MKAIIVEDDALVGDAVRRALLRAGFEAQLLVSGQAGLEALSGGLWDLAVIDVDLPLVDGIALVCEMRRRGHARPVVMLSAHDEESRRQRALAAGASDYLTKPFEVAELITRCLAQVTDSPPDLNELSPCHRRIWQRLARDKGQIVSCEGLALAARCTPGELADQVTALRDKLPCPESIRQVRGLGYRLASPRLDGPPRR